MSAFPRQVLPSSVTPFRYPSPLINLGTTGKTQLRSIGAMGHMWDEVFGPIKMTDPVVRGWWSQVMQLWQHGTTFDVVHQLYKVCNGVGTGTPLVNGAAQSGASLVTDGWTASQTNILRAGDIIRIGGLNPIFEIQADVNSDGGGNATLTVDPLIPTSLSPANNASITCTGVTLRANLIAVPPIGPTQGARPDEFQAGIVLSFAEAL